MSNNIFIVFILIIFTFISGVGLGVMSVKPETIISACPMCGTCKCEATDCFSEVISDIRVAEGYKDTLKELME